MSIYTFLLARYYLPAPDTLHLKDVLRIPSLPKGLAIYFPLLSSVDDDSLLHLYLSRCLCPDTKNPQWELAVVETDQ